MQEKASGVLPSHWGAPLTGVSTARPSLASQRSMHLGHLGCTNGIPCAVLQALTHNTPGTVSVPTSQGTALGQLDGALLGGLAWGRGHRNPAPLQQCPFSIRVCPAPAGLEEKPGWRTS